jgi:hypothetical protein
VKRLFVLLFTVAGISAAGQLDQLEPTIFFSRSGLSISTSGGYDRVSLKNTNYYTDQVGAPELPALIAYASLPAGAQVQALKVNYARCETLPGTYQVYPRQSPRPLSAVTSSIGFNEPDEKIYNSPKNFPASIAELKTSGSLAGCRLVGIMVYPVRYLPAQHKLLFYPELKLMISYDRKSLPQTRYSTPAGQALIKELVKGIVLNPEAVGDNTPSSFGTGANTVEYLVITSDDFAPAFASFIDWQNKKGVPAAIKTLGWIYSRYPGRDNAEKVRNCIIDGYKNWGTVWVLLGGDADVVPARMVYLSALGEVDMAPSDLYFSDLDRTWDENGNGVFGELDDSLDLFPEVFVGRVPAHSSSEVSGFVGKILTYEKKPKPDHGRRMLFMAFDADDITPSEESKDLIDDESVPPRFDPIKKIYDSNPGFHKQDCLNALNSGYNIINHSDHGDYGTLGAGWINHGEVITSADVGNLKNQDRPSIFYSVACRAGGFHKSCVGGSLVTTSPGGMIGFIGNSSLGWYLPSSPGQGPSELYDRRFFNSLFLENLSALGMIFADSKLLYIAACQSYGTPRWLALDLNLLGEPEVMVLTDQASSLQLTYPAYITIGPNTFTATVKADNQPVASALVCVIKDNEIYQRGFTDFDGQVRFEINPATPGSMSITATAHNFIPDEGTVTVTQVNGPYIVLYNQTIDDQTGGDDDGFVDAGEIIRYQIRLKNAGSEVAQFVKARLTTSNPFVAISQSVALYHDIPPSLTQTSLPPFQFSVQPGCPGNSSILFDLTVTDMQARTWIYHPAVTVTGPALSYDSHTINDRAGGNWNSVPEAGEVVEMAITMRNLGSRPATGIEATLTTKDPFIKLFTTTAPLGTIKPESTATNTHDPYRFYIKPNCPRSHPVLFQSAMKTAGAYAPTDSFTVTIAPYALHFTDIADSANVADWGGAGGGCAFSDFNQDRYVDLYVGNRSGGNVLYKNTHDNKFVNVAESAGVAYQGRTYGVCFGDIDNDGFPDLFVAAYSQSARLYKNNGDGTFTDITDSARLTNSGCFSGTFADVDRDGLLDLFLTCKYGENLLFHNNGNCTFTDVTQQANVAGLVGSFMGVFGDVNSDGAPDLFVVNAGAANTFYLNDGAGKFIDATAGSGIDKFSGSTGAIFGDYNNDGNLDLFLTYAGQNVLLHNDGKSHFTDVTADAGIGDSSYSRGAQFGDVNNDGNLDIYIANDGRNTLYLNRGDGTFRRATDSAQVGNAGHGIGCAFGDIDNDGDLDLYVTNSGDSNVLYRNDKNTPDFLEFRVTGTESNRDGIGTRIKIYDAGHAGEPDYFRQMREVSAGSGEYCMNSLVCHFGAAPGKRYEVEATFPSGRTTVTRNLRAGSINELVEPSAGIDEPPKLLPGKNFILYQNYPNPFNRTTRIKLFLPQAGLVRLRIYDASGRMVKNLLDTRLNAGECTVNWNGQNEQGQTVASGIYFYRLESGSFSGVKKTVLLR